MDQDKLLAFHEKQYFHELDCREKLTARLQLTLAMLTAIIAALAYIIVRTTFQSNPSPFASALFLVSMVSSVVLVGAAAIFFVRAVWGHQYECLPVATEIEKYRDLLVQTYKDYENGAGLSSDYYQKFLIRYFSECASSNAAVNRDRYDLLHDSMSNIVYSLPTLVVACLTFKAGGFAGPLAG